MFFVVYVIGSLGFGGAEKDFQAWYQGYANQLGLCSDPDNPKHCYDYRSAWKTGAVPDSTGHWPSRFKTLDHPNRFVNGIDTRELNRCNCQKSILSVVRKILLHLQ